MGVSKLSAKVFFLKVNYSFKERDGNKRYRVTECILQMKDTRTVLHCHLVLERRTFSLHQLPLFSE